MSKEIEKKDKETAPADAPTEPKEDRDEEEADAPAEGDEPEGDEPKEEGAENTDKDRDYAAELEEEEKKHGKPDPEKAKDAFKKRTERRKEDDTDEDEPADDPEEDDKPLTKKEFREMMARNRKQQQEADALVLAGKLAASLPEAKLVFAKWKNRTWPESMSLTEQIEEAFAITHRKKILGENAELKRALKGKAGVVKDAAGTHRDAPSGNKKPKMSPQDAAAIVAAGFALNTKNGRYEKRLPNGQLLIKDPQTGQTSIVKQ